MTLPEVNQRDNPVPRPPVKRAVTAGKGAGSRTLAYLFGAGWERDTTYRADCLLTRPRTTEGRHVTPFASAQSSDKETERELVKQILASEKWLTDPNSFLSCVVRASTSLLRLASQDVKTENTAPPPSAVPKKFWIYSETPLCQSLSPELISEAAFDEKRKLWRTKVFPSEKPSGRTEVVFLAHSMDQMLSNVDVSVITRPEECFDPSSSTFNDTFRKLLSVYNIGFAEITRHVYTQCVERGVFVDKVRCLYVDLANNCFEVITYLKKKLIAEANARKLVEHNLLKATEESTATKYEVMMRDGELKTQQLEIDTLQKRLRDQVALELREDLMKQFIQNQAERNAMILQLNENTQHSGALLPSDANPQKQHDRDDERFDDMSDQEFSDRHSLTAPDARPSVSRAHDVPKTEAGTQTESDDWDQPLIEALMEVCQSLKDTSSVTEDITPMYSAVLFNSPLESVREADASLKEVVHDIKSEKRQNTAPKTQPFVVPKKLVANALSECGACLKEVNMRLSSHLSSLKTNEKTQRSAEKSERNLSRVRSVRDVPAKKELPARSSEIELSARMALTPPDSHSVCPLCMRSPPQTVAPPASSRAQRQQASPQEHREPGHDAVVQCDSCDFSRVAELETKMKSCEGDLLSMSTGTETLVAVWQSKLQDAEKRATDLERDFKKAVKELKAAIEKNEEYETRLRSDRALPRGQAQPTTEASANGLEWVDSESDPEECDTRSPVRLGKRDEGKNASSHSLVSQPASKAGSIVFTRQTSGVEDPSRQAAPFSFKKQFRHEVSIELPPDPDLILKGNSVVISTTGSPRSSGRRPSPRLTDDASRKKFSITIDRPLQDADRGSPAGSPAGVEELSSSFAEAVVAPLQEPPTGEVPQDLVVFLRGPAAPDATDATEKPLTTKRSDVSVTRRLSKKSTPVERQAELEAGRQKRREKQASEKFALMSQIVSGTYQSKSLPWVLKQVSSLYRAKYTADLSVSGMTRTSLAEFMIDRMRQRHGSKKISDEQIGIMVTTVKSHAPADPRVEMFSKFLSGVYPLASLATMLRYSKAIDDAKVGPDYSKGSDENPEPGLVSLVRCLFVVGQLETCEETIMSITKQCQAVSVPVSPGSFRAGMAKTGYAVNDIPKIESQWKCDSQTSHDAVRKVDFLQTVTDHAIAALPTPPSSPTSPMTPTFMA